MAKQTAPRDPVFSIVDGNTGKTIKEISVRDVPESVRYVHLKRGTRVLAGEDADQRVEIVRVVRYTYDRNGDLIGEKLAYNGFLKHFNAAGEQIVETYVVYKRGATLMSAAEFGKGVVGRDRKNIRR